MENQEKTHALILEKDHTVIESIIGTQKMRSYAVTTSSNKQKALRLLKDKLYSLAFVGETGHDSSPFEAMKEIVMASPMTSIILITDLSNEETLEKAEGYGILGRVNRTVPPDELTSLLERFDEISRSLSPSGR